MFEIRTHRPQNAGFRAHALVTLTSALVQIQRSIVFTN